MSENEECASLVARCSTAPLTPALFFSACSSMTAVPKPLKFLGPHWAALKAVFAGMAGAHLANKPLLADVLSVLALTMGAEDAREVLRFRLQGSGTAEDVGTWGHEYVRSLAGELGVEWRARVEAGGEAAQLGDLLTLVNHIVPFNMSHNAEPEAVDLLLEIGRLHLLLELDYTSGSRGTPKAGQSSAARMDKDSALRVCAYLLKCADYMGDAKEIAGCLDTAYAVFVDQGDAPAALRVILRRGGAPEVVEEQVRALCASCKDAGVRRQLAYALGRHRVNVSLGDATLDALVGNHTLSELFAVLARDLDVVEARTPEDIYKSHLGGDAKPGEGADKLDSARANLASTYVNAFVNAGFGTDKLMTTADSSWVYRNKGAGQTAAAASLGLLHLWNEQQISALDKYLSAAEESVKAGALLGIALACVGTRNSESDPCFALLSEHLEAGSASGQEMKIAALQGLGLAYVGTRREDIADLCLPFIQDSSGAASMELAAIAGLALGQVWLGSAHEVYAALIADRLLACNDAEAGMAITRHLALGLGLLFLGRCEAADVIVEIVSVIAGPDGSAHGSVAKAILQACAYAGTGEVLQIQSFLRTCAEHPEMEDKEKEDKAKEEAERVAAAGPTAGAGAGAGAGVGAGAGAPAPAAATETPRAGRYLHQTASVLGLALVSLGEELSVSLAGRMAEHLLLYGDPAVRRGVPLAVALCHLSDPEYGIVDTLSKLSHDSDLETAQGAIFGLGLVGAGTNNSRVAGLLRTLAVFYKGEPDALFVTRLAQGLLHCGKVRAHPFDGAASPPVLTVPLSSLLFHSLAGPAVDAPSPLGPRHRVPHGPRGHPPRPPRVPRLQGHDPRQVAHAALLPRCGAQPPHAADRHRGGRVAGGGGAGGTGCGDGGPGGQAQDHHWIPDAPDARAAEREGPRGAGRRLVHPAHERSGGRRGAALEPRERGAAGAGGA